MAKETYSKIADASVDEDSPVDETLMKDGIRDNQEGLRFLIGNGNSIFDDFGGDGSDGPRTDSSSTNLDVGTGKQYTNWTIDASQTVTLDQPTGGNGVVRIGVSGTLTINGTLDGTGAGLSGGAAVAIDTAGNAGTDSEWWIGGASAGGGGAGGSPGSQNGGAGGSAVDRVASHAGGAAGSGGDGGAGVNAVTTHPRYYGDLGILGPGPGGGSGGGSNAGVGKAGGNGGPLLIIEADAVVLGASSVINAAGADGTDGASTDDAGGGGGAGGIILILCRTLTDGGVTTSVAGGTGGTKGTGGNDGGDGGDGWVLIQEVI